MAEFRLTKSELRNQQVRLYQLQRYLPTLQLKKALLQAEVANAESQRDMLQKAKEERWKQLVEIAPLVSSDPTVPLERIARVEHVEKKVEHIAGADLSAVESVSFHPFQYDLYDTPPWLDCLVEELREFRTVDIRLEVANERIAILMKELKDVSIRVNLFEKVLIPQAEKYIKKIRIFLNDLQLAAVAQAKVAKAKIIAKSQVIGKNVL
jgi:V/A-type H+/Na+-transporting ATPase subunit D